MRAGEVRPSILPVMEFSTATYEVILPSDLFRQQTMCATWQQILINLRHGLHYQSYNRQFFITETESVIAAADWQSQQGAPLLLIEPDLTISNRRSFLGLATKYQTVLVVCKRMDENTVLVLPPHFSFMLPPDHKQTVELQKKRAAFDGHCRYRSALLAITVSFGGVQMARKLPAAHVWANLIRPAICGSGVNRFRIFDPAAVTR